MSNCLLWFHKWSEWVIENKIVHDFSGGGYRQQVTALKKRECLLCGKIEEKEDGKNGY